MTPWCLGPVSYVLGSCNSPVSYTPGSHKFDPLKIQNCPMYRGVATPHCPKLRGVILLFVWTFKPMLLHLKRHSFKKLSNISIYFTNTVQTCLKIFPYSRFLGWLNGVLSTWESFWNTYNPKSKKNQNGPRISLMGPGGANWGKKPTTRNLVRLSL